MITATDIKKLKSVFATKEDLEKSEIKTAQGFADQQKQTSNIQDNLTHLEKKVEDIKNHMVAMEVNILHAINNLANENLVTSTYRPKIEDHENRISRLESAVLGQ